MCGEGPPGPFSARGRASMDELYRVGEKVAKDNAGLAADPQAFAEAMAADPALAELLGKGGDIEEYLQGYEQMLQEGLSAGGPQLNQVDHEGGITVRPEPGFVIKTRDQASGMKVFLNIVANEHVEAPHMRSIEEMNGEEGCRVPLSVGTPQEDFDKKNEPCVTYDLVANPTVVEECGKIPAFRDTVVQLCLAAVAQKYKIDLDPHYKLPKMKYKGANVQLQRIRKKKLSQIEEVPGSGAMAPPLPGQKGQGVDGGQEEGGPRQPDFCIFFSKAEAEVIDGFAEQWGPPPDEVQDVADTMHVNGLDLPCYRTNEFKERIRGTMRNKSEKQSDEPRLEEKPGEAETREILVGRTCVVQVRMPDLDQGVPSLKQFRAEVSDECLRVHFPMLPRSRRTAYLPLTLWWPQTFCSAQAKATWHAASDTLTVSLPTELPKEASAFDKDLLDAVF